MNFPKICFGPKLTNIIVVLQAPITTTADNILFFFFFPVFQKMKIRLDFSCELSELSAQQTIHMTCQALFDQENKNILECHLLQF